MSSQPAQHDASLKQNLVNHIKNIVRHGEKTVPLKDIVQKEDIRKLSELRVEVQNLQSFLIKVRNGDIRITEFNNYIDKRKYKISDLVNSLTSDIENNQEQDTERSDNEYIETIYGINNLWELMSCNDLLKNPSATFEAQIQLHCLDLLEGQINIFVYLIGTRTIPFAVKDWLLNPGSGDYLPFHTKYENELPLLTDRMRILNSMTWTSKSLPGGIIDEEGGFIYRFSNNKWHQAFSLFGVLGIIVLTFLLINLIANLPISNWPITSNDTSQLIIGWGALLIGIVIHIVIKGAKQKANGGLPPMIGRLIPLLNARWKQILWKITLALIGFFCLVFAVGIKDVSPLNTFLTGYTLDSFIELFGTTLDQKANDQLAMMKQQSGSPTSK